MYIKADAHEKLLLSEVGQSPVSITLVLSHGEEGGSGIVTQPMLLLPESACSGDSQVPTVWVRFMQSLRLLPHQSAAVDVQLEPGNKPGESGGIFLEPCASESVVQVEDSLLCLEEGGCAQVAVFNNTGCSCLWKQVRN